MNRQVKNLQGIGNFFPGFQSRPLDPKDFCMEATGTPLQRVGFPGASCTWAGCHHYKLWRKNLLQCSRWDNIICLSVLSVFCQRLHLWNLWSMFFLLCIYFFSTLHGMKQCHYLDNRSKTQPTHKWVNIGTLEAVLDVDFSNTDWEKLTS